MEKWILLTALCFSSLLNGIYAQGITCTAYARSASGAGQCDGLITLRANGGSGPYTFYLDSVSNLTGLYMSVCQGLHQFFATDAGGTSTLPQYIVVGSLQSSFALADTFGSQPVIDSVTSNVQNCNYNYNVVVDSVHLDSIEPLATAQQYIAWFDVWQNGQQISFTDTIVLDSIGINQVSVIMYCDTTHRAVEGTLTIKFYMDNNNHGSATAVSALATDKNQLEVFPNPASDFSTVYVQLPEPEKFDLTITDLSGQFIQRMNNLSNNQVQLNLNNLAAGVYVVTMRSNEAVVSKQLVKF